MAKKQQKRLEKKRREEKETKKKLQEMKLRKRKQAKEDREKSLLERKTEPRIDRLKKIAPTPPSVIVPPSQMTKEMIAERIAENCKKLKELEKKYENEMLEREAANAALEAEGYKTMEEKMKFLGEQAEAMASKEYEKELKVAEKKLRKKMRRLDK